MPHMKSIHQWFDEYGVSHQNPTNKLIHWFCVPVIYFCVMGLLYSIPLPHGAAAVVVMMLTLVFYALLSITLAVGVGLINLVMYSLLLYMDLAGLPIAWVCLGLFVVAWVGQFVGHNIEGAKPSFFKDVQFLLIGPAWLLGFIYRRLGVAY